MGRVDEAAVSVPQVLMFLTSPKKTKKVESNACSTADGEYRRLSDLYLTTDTDLLSDTGSRVSDNRTGAAGFDFFPDDKNDGYSGGLRDDAEGVEVLPNRRAGVFTRR
jgi:hypothetical protein